MCLESAGRSRGGPRKCEQTGDWAIASVYHHRLFLDGPAGRLEAILWTFAETDPPMAALVCHPHPLFGGTMHNKVVFRVAKTLHELGLPVLRFNFRGAGRSEGVHDEGRGERDDVRAALDWLAAKFPGKPILLAGFSFGALVGSNVGCRDERVHGIVCLGLPVNRNEAAFLRDCNKPKLFLQGSEDQFGDVNKLQGIVSVLQEPKHIVVVPGVDHFFTGKLEEVDRVLSEWMFGWQPKVRPNSSSTEEA